MEGEYRAAQAAGEKDVQAARRAAANRRDRELANAESAMQRAKRAPSIASRRIRGSTMKNSPRPGCAGRGDGRYRAETRDFRKSLDHDFVFDAGRRVLGRNAKAPHAGRRSNREGEKPLARRGAVASGARFERRRGRAAPSATVTTDDVNEVVQVMQASLSVAEQQLEKLKGCCCEVAADGGRRACSSS